MRADEMHSAEIYSAEIARVHFTAIGLNAL